LDGFLAAGDLVTRKQAKAAVRDGRVTVDGVVAADPGLHLTGGERVALDGSWIAPPGEVHVMMNKPAGCVTARSDSRDRAVMDILPASLRDRAGPVGRLDKDATGLLLFTGDGQLAHRLISPKYRVEKRYLVEAEGRLTADDARAMAGGIPLKDFTCLPAALEILDAQDDISRAEIVIYEGKYHQVKRMFRALGHPVRTLHRLSIGGVCLDPALEPGAYRELTAVEAARLYGLTGLEKE